jgi:hypothetical protein
MEGAADVDALNKIFAHAGRDLLIRELTLDSRNVRPVTCSSRCRAARSMAVPHRRCPGPRRRRRGL